jgi:cytochrome P450
MPHICRFLAVANGNFLFKMPSIPRKLSSMLTTVLSLLITLLAVSASYLFYLRRKNFITGIPFAPRGIFGSIGFFTATEIVAWLEYYAFKLGPIFQVDMLSGPFVIVSDFDAIQAILKSRPNLLSRSKVIDQVFNDLDVAGVFSEEGIEWKSSRQLVAPAFTASKVRLMNAAIIKHAHLLKDKLIDMEKRQGELLELFFGNENGYRMNYDPSKLIQIDTILQEFSLGLILEAIFGISKSALTASDFNMVNIMDTLNNRCFELIPWHQIYKTKGDLMCERDLQRVLGFIERNISDYYEACIEFQATAKPNPYSNTIFESMLLAAEEGNEKNKRISKITIEKIKRNMFHLIIAGTDTTAVQLKWIMYYLSVNSTAQKRVQQEADTVLKTKTATDLAASDLPYCTNVMREAIRLSPAATFLGFDMLADGEILGHKIPKGTNVYAMLRASGLKSNFLKDPFKFCPERWEAEETKQLLAGTLLAFGGGPRICPGRNLAMEDIVVAIALAFAPFDISLFPRLPSEPGVLEETHFTNQAVNFYPLLNKRSL